MNGFRQGWLVTKRELRERSRSRAFLVSLVVMIVAVVAAIALPSLIETNETKDIGLVGTTPATLSAAITSQAEAVGTKTRVHRYADLAEGEQAVRDGKIDVLIVDNSRLEWQRRADEQLKAVVTAAIQISAVEDRASAAGITANQLADLLAPVAITNVELGHVAGRSPDDETAALLMTVLLFMTIATYGAMVLNGVIEEKASRVVEVLLARIPARSLLAGKIAGIGLLGLGQVAVTALAALIAAETINDVNLPAVRAGVLIWAVLWFVLGYALYATVFGALGSLASRPEDAQSVSGPVGVILVLVYFVSFAAVGSPETVWARVIAWLPLTAPIAMPARIAMGAATWWEPMLAAMLTVGAIAGLVVFGGRVYAAAVLHNGPTLKLREVWPQSQLPRDRPVAAVAPQSPSEDRERSTARPRSSSRPATPRVVALLIGLTAGGITVAVTADVVIGLAVAAALFALVDRVTKARRSSPRRVDSESVR
jgi:ABC-2 type transport system permease protein